MARRIRITLAYDGSAYRGWQLQPGLATIQAEVEKVATRIEGRAVSVHASGRTDTGVHALAQVAAFDLDNPIPLRNLRKAMNLFLPRDIRVVDIADAPPDFHPRHDAFAKVYEYRILRDEICSPFERRYVHHYPYPLDEAAMELLAPLLEGEHDFTAFATADPKHVPLRSKVRTVFSSRIERSGSRLLYRVRGSGFLKHMVRNIVGVLIEGGKGNVSPAGLLKRLEPGSGIPPGPTAPSSGLFLVGVEYAPTDDGGEGVTGGSS